MTSPDKLAHGTNALRRALLILVTALIVARPLVPGEDPGLLELFSTPAGLVLNVFWLVAAIAFAGWRLWAGQGTWRVGLVELALAAFAAALFITAGVSASYLRPALLIAWETLLLAVVFSLVRNVAAEPRDRRGLLAALLTTAVCAGGFGIYQQFTDLPRLHEQGADVNYLQSTLEERYDLPTDSDSPRLAAWAERLRSTTVFSTFSSPRTFACYLTLTLPILLGLILTLRSWLVGPLVVMALMMGVALWLTFCPECWAALVVGGTVGLVLAWRQLTGWRRLGAVAGLVVLAVVWVAGQFGVGCDCAKTAAAQSAAIGLIQNHPWLGVGAGNFSRHFPPSSDFIAWQEGQGPRCALLEATTAGGVGLGLLLVVVLGVVLGSIWKRVRVEDQSSTEKDEGPVPWEFYIGGMAGLLLAFALRAMGQPSVEVVREGWAAIVRSLIWFPAFGVFLAVLRTGWMRGGILMAGWVACLGTLMISDGFFFPALAQPLWTLAALMVPATAVTSLEGSRLWQRARVVWALPVMIALTGFFLLAFIPVALSTQSLDWVRVARVVFRDLSRQEKEKSSALELNKRINGQLDAAAKADPLNVMPLLAWAEWSRVLGLVYKGVKYADAASEFLVKARQLDPLSLEPDLLEFTIHVDYARHFEEERKRHLDAAEKLLDEIVKRDPVEAALLHYRMAEVCFAVKDNARGRPHAEASLELSPGRLSSSKVQLLRTWIKAP